jgi:hypothetical protein
MANGIDVVVGLIAARQFGVFARCQVLEAGGDDALIRRRVNAGRWANVGPGVYRLVGVPATFEQRVWIAYLATGPLASVSFETAAAFAEFRTFPRREVVLTVPHGGHARVEGAFVHQISDVQPHHLMRRYGLNVTTPARTAVDLAAVYRYPRVFDVIEDAAARGILRLPDLASCFADVVRPRKPGMRTIARVLDTLQGGQPLPESRLEKRLHEMVERAGTPPLVRQLALPGRQSVKGCVDGADPEAMLIAEADGRTWHARIQQLKRDHERDAEAARAGWQTLRFLHENLTNDPDGESERWRETRETRLRQLSRQ